jgi:lycopene beta-cyclase
MPRTSLHDADLVILGGGCAGLSLAHRIALSDSPMRVIVVDVRTSYSDDRSWCFWADDSHELRALVHHQWESWVYQRAGSAAHPHRVDGLSYQYIRGVDFYTYCRSIINSSPTVELRLGVAAGEVRPLRPGLGTGDETQEGLVVSTTAGDLTARWVVDTRPRRTAAMLYQCFSGAEIDHGGALDLAALGIAPGTAGLMTGMRADVEGLGFVYVLPLTATTAMVEWTRFSAVPLGRRELRTGRDAVLSRLGAPLGAPGVRVLREEGGVLPMGRIPDTSDTTTVPETIPGVVVAGAAGGALRDASGYAFARIQAWARECAEGLARGQAPVGHPAEPVIRRQMDRIFLQALRAHPERSAAYLEAMARGVAPHRLLRFLTDRATLTDLLAIIASLPLLPFLAEIPDRSRRLATRSVRRPDLLLPMPRAARATTEAVPESAAASDPLEQVAS